MPDISMCFEKNAKLCDRKDKCFRYIAEPDKYQYYSDFNPKTCDCFIHAPTELINAKQKNV